MAQTPDQQVGGFGASPRRGPGRVAFLPVIGPAWFCAGLLVVAVSSSGVSAQEAASPASRSTGARSAAARPHGLVYPGKKYRDAFAAAAAHYERAIQGGAAKASDYVGQAEACTALWCFGFAPRSEVLPRAKAALTAALELDNQSAAAHTALAVVHLSDGNWSGAEGELNRALGLAPESAKPHHWYALYLSAMGRHAEALQQAERAELLDPSPGTRTVRGATLYFARDFAGLIGQMERTTALDPDFAPAYDWLGMAYLQAGRYDDAIKAYERAVALSDGMAEIKAGLGHALGVAGRSAEARSVRDQLHELATRWYIPPVQIAFVHISLGEKDRAFEMLEKAFRQRSWELVFLQVEPWLDQLRCDPRFDDLLQRMNFPVQKRRG